MIAPATILETIRQRGGQVYLLDGDQIAVTPSTALDDGLRGWIRAHKAELVAALRTSINCEIATAEAARPAAFNYFDSRFAAVFADLTGSIGHANDLRALEWAERHGWPTIIATLVAADRQCEQLAAEDDEPGFRRAVARLVGLFNAIRDAHRAHVEAAR